MKINISLFDKKTFLKLFVIFNALALIFLFSINILTTYILKKSQSEQIAIENRNNIIISDFRAVFKSLNLRVNKDFSNILILDENKNILNQFGDTSLFSNNLIKFSVLNGKISYPIYFDENKTVKFGEIIFFFPRVTSVLTLFYFWIFIILLSFPIIFKVVIRINKKISKDLENKKLSAIGQTTSLLAHDVRKPFILVKNLINMIDDFKESPLLLEQSKAEINNAIRDVDVMIDDIMDFSREVKLETEAINVINIISTLMERFSKYQSASNEKYEIIHFNYQLKNNFCPLVDQDRLIRAMTNIVNNAIDAITIIGNKKTGTIIFKSRDIKIKNSLYIEISIGNDGPPFKPHHIPCLFDSFFTEGKKNGTGLGLASVKKIIELHDGHIFAENFPDGDGVQFVMRIPASNVSDEFKIATKLPTELGNCEVSKIKEKSKSKVELVTAPEQANFTSNNSNIMYDYIYIDDENILRKSWERSAKRNNIKLLTCSSPDELYQVLNLVSKNDSKIYIDRELGDNFPKGELIAQDLYEKGFMNVHLATGHHPSKFQHLNWLKCQGKIPPWEPQENF
jgi:signal transduction histidine kinase